MILLLDNYDSFTYNLVQRLGEIDSSLEIRVVRNDQTTVEEIESWGPERIIISPGPCTPAEAGLSKAVIEHFGPRVPVLGVCLGHQCLAEVYRSRVVRADRLMHGKTCEVEHEEDELFEGVPVPFTAMRYHSLVAERDTLPQELVITAWSKDKPRKNEIMGVKHRKFPIYGVQFHPESIGTEDGKRMLQNFLRIAHASN